MKFITIALIIAAVHCMEETNTCTKNIDCPGNQRCALLIDEVANTEKNECISEQACGLMLNS